MIARQKILNDRVSVARRMLTDCNMRVAREDIALEAAYWGQFPGCFGRRLRKAPITSRNFASMSPWHNFPTGRARDNHWGDALTLLITSARSPFFFSLHSSDPKDNDSRRDVGHTFICGPTGVGKTVFIGFLITKLTKFGCTQVLFDKDRGLDILIRVLGGEYLPLRLSPPFPRWQAVELETWRSRGCLRGPCMRGTSKRQPGACRCVRAITSPSSASRIISGSKSDCAAMRVRRRRPKTAAGYPPEYLIGRIDGPNDVISAFRHLQPEPEI